MQSLAFLVIENHGQIPSYNTIPSNPQTGHQENPEDTRARSMSKIFPSAGNKIIHLDQIQHYSKNASKGLTPDDVQFPRLQPPPGTDSFWFINPNEDRVDLSVYENDTDQYTNQLIGYSGSSYFMHEKITNSTIMVFH